MPVYLQFASFSPLLREYFYFILYLYRGNHSQTLKRRGERVSLLDSQPYEIQKHYKAILLTVYTEKQTNNYPFTFTFTSFLFSRFIYTEATALIHLRDEENEYIS